MSVRWVFLAKRLLWFAAALVVGALSLGSPARAGCGNHVLALAHRLDVDSLASVDGLLPETDNAPGSDAPSRPCTGPSCSRRPLVPMATPTPRSPLPDRCVRLSHPEPRIQTSWWSAFARTEPAYPRPALDHPERPPRP